jgi:hypothetical protein
MVNDHLLDSESLGREEAIFTEGVYIILFIYILRGRIKGWWKGDGVDVDE